MIWQRLKSGWKKCTTANGALLRGQSRRSCDDARRELEDVLLLADVVQAAVVVVAHRLGGSMSTRVSRRAMPRRHALGLHHLETSLAIRSVKAIVVDIGEARRVGVGAVVARLLASAGADHGRDGELSQRCDAADARSSGSSRKSQVDPLVCA